MEINLVRLSGVIEDIQKPRKSPAGVVHQVLVLSHRSRQVLMGQEREIKAKVLVKLTGSVLVQRVEALQLGNKVTVNGILAQTSFKDTQQLLIHAQAIERFE